MLLTKKLAANTIRVYSSYIKPYLTFLDRPRISPEQAPYQTMRDFLGAIQSEHGHFDRTISMIISYLQFFRCMFFIKTGTKHRSLSEHSTQSCHMPLLLPRSGVSFVLLIILKLNWLFPALRYRHAPGWILSPAPFWYHAFLYETVHPPLKKSQWPLCPFDGKYLANDLIYTGIPFPKDNVKSSDSE